MDGILQSMGKYTSPNLIRISEYEDKLLGEVLVGLDRNVKIGFYNGSGYLYCGESSAILENPDIIDAETRKQNEERLKKAMSNVKTALKNSRTSPDAYIDHLLRKEGGNIEELAPNLDGYLEYLEKKFKHICALCMNVRANRERMESYMPILDRRVMEAYPTIASWEPPGTLCLLVEGTGECDLWSTDEVEMPLQTTREFKGGRFKGDDLIRIEE